MRSLKRARERPPRRRHARRAPRETDIACVMIERFPDVAPSSRPVSSSLQAIESRKALLCVLAQDCDQADYTKLIQALCNEVNVHLIRVPQAVQLGEWAGLCKLDAEGTARKVVKCSCVVVSDFGEESEGLAVLQEFLKQSSA